MNRLSWLLGVLVSLALASASCSSTPCNPQSPLIYVDLPGGTESVSSFAATGACATVLGGCEPVAASCQTAGCECRYTLQVNPATFDASPDGICHIDVVAKDGGVFSKDLAYTSNGSSCFGVSGPVGITIVPQFSAAPPIDAAATDGPTTPADGGSTDADARPADAVETDAADGPG